MVSRQKTRLDHRLTPRRRKILLNLALVIPLLVYCLPMILTGNKIIPGDADYAFQLAEAFRKSVILYHQFPWWNPWISGGIPLFANVQLGVFSIQAPFILLFGSVVGWKIAILIYQIICFFGFKKLFTDYFKTDNLRAILLAYIPAIGGFFTYRVIAGHFTFLLIAFVPWLLLFFLKRQVQLYWLWFALILSFMIWSSPHYVTIMSILAVIIWFIFQKIAASLGLLRSRVDKSTFLNDLKYDILFFLKATGLTIVLSFYRMYFVTKFLDDYPRPTIGGEHFTGVRTGLHAIWGINQYKNPGHLPTGLGWVEASTYIGLGSLLVVLTIILAWAIKVRQSRYKSLSAAKLFSYSPILLAVLFCTFFVLGMGNMGPYSPYILLHHLPIFNSMRVATRWLMWSSLCVLFFIAAYQGRRFARLINIFLLAAVAELFVTGLPSISNAYFTKVQQYRPPTATFNQVTHYNVPRPLYAPDVNFQKIYFYDENLYETTLNNLGQVIAGDALVDTRKPNTTIRCGANQPDPCPFVSSNAKVIGWSPNKITLQRLSGGNINLNMNPGRDWKVNGKYVFLGYKVAEPKKLFTIQDPSRIIVLQYAPRISL